MQNKSSNFFSWFIPFLLLGLMGVSSCGVIRDVFYPFGRIDWHSSLEKVLEAKDDRPVLLFFHNEFECPYCQKVIAKILPDQRFVEKTKFYRCVHYNIDEAGKKLLQQFQVTAHPAFLIVNDRGKVLDRVVGYDPQAIFALLDRHRE